MNDRRLAGQVALVTGAASGIGRETALILAREGAVVVATDINKAGVEETVGLIVEEGYDARAWTVDITRSEQVNQLVAEVVAALGRLDILVNSAGIVRFADVESCTDEEWDQVIKVNLTSQFYTIRAAYPIMKEQGGGKIVNLSSSSAMSGSNFGGIHYTASKAGTLGLTRAVARRGAPYGIRCNTICPGLTDTPMARDPDAPEGAFDNIVDKVPMGRIAHPKDIAKAVFMLVSDDSSYITGINLNVTGGRYMF